MFKMLVSLAAASTIVMAGGVIAPVEVAAPVAEKDFYIGLSTTIGDSVVQNDFEAFTSTGVGVQAGYVFYRADAFDVAIEARYTAILTGSYENFGDNQTYGAFIKPRYNFGPVAAYGLIGYSAVDTVIEDTDGFAYGLGLSTEVYDFELFVDYVINDDNEFSALSDFDYDNFSNEVVTVGINYKF